MKKTLILACTLALLTALAIHTQAPANADDHKPAKPNTAPDGWTALFDGESLVGWTVLSGKAEYDVVDGTIKGTTRKGSPNTFLCTTETYGDFELQFEVKLHDPQLNSGVQLRSKIVNPQGGNYGGRIGGPQVEISANRQAGFVYGEGGLGGWWSKDVKGRRHDHFNKGQWNQYHVIAKGDNIKTFINGNQVADMTYPHKHKDDFREGVIGLQVHSVGGDPNWSVAWRNIYIKELGE